MGLLSNNHIYSFSQLSSFDECPYGFYLDKIERVDKKENAFAQYGTLIHDLLDKWGKKELTKEDMVREYMRRYPDEVVNSWPKMLESKGYATKAYDMGIDYLQNFDEFEGYEVIETEQKYETDIDGNRFCGIVDMVVKDINSGEMIIVDHKSKSLSAFKQHENEMYRQQLMYSKFFYEKFGRYPDRLMFNLFKENGQKMERKFSMNEYNETIDWAIETIKKMNEYTMFDYFECKSQDFFCTELCSVRGHCSNGVAKYQTKKKKK